VLSSPGTAPEIALAQAVEAVYGVAGSASDALADWFARAEEAYFSRADFEIGHGSLSLEPLIWQDDPAAPGPPVYLKDRMSAEARADYARALERLKAEFETMTIPNREAAARTCTAIAGTLGDIAALA
jgi:hypothetical protein